MLDSPAELAAQEVALLLQIIPDRYTIHQLTNIVTIVQTTPQISGIQYAAKPSTNQMIQNIFFS